MAKFGMDVGYAVGPSNTLFPAIEKFAPAEGLGEGREDGSTRKRVMELRETLRGSALTKAVEMHPNQLARP